MQRKFRNQEEKQIIVHNLVNEVQENAHFHVLEENVKVQLDEIFGQYLVKNTGCLTGSIKLESINKVLEYSLPTRRVQKQYIRIVQDKEKNDVTA